eukprot:scaffold1195_cov200-Alexandrium_tamarense.AAC.11
MIATAPESVQQRRRLNSNSPRVTPTKQPLTRPMSQSNEDRTPQSLERRPQDQQHMTPQSCLHRKQEDESRQLTPMPLSGERQRQREEGVHIPATTGDSEVYNMQPKQTFGVDYVVKETIIEPVGGGGGSYQPSSSVETVNANNNATDSLGGECNNISVFNGTMKSCNDPSNNLRYGVDASNSMDYKRSASMEPLFDKYVDEPVSSTALPLKTPLEDSVDFDEINVGLLDERGNGENSLLSSASEDVGETDFLREGNDVLKPLNCVNSTMQEQELSTDLSSADSSQSNSTASFNLRTQYQRTCSMEPIFDKNSNEMVSHDLTLTSLGNQAMGQTSLLSADSEDVYGEQMSPEMNANARKTLHNPTSPLVYELSAQPSSPLMSDIQSEILHESVGRVCAQLKATSLSFDSTSDVGGDAYFEPRLSPATQDSTMNERVLHEGEEGVNFDREVDLMQPIALPPRLKRTTDELKSALDRHTTPAARSQQQFTTEDSHTAHTHSLLDDCSDEEDDIGSFTMVDSPTRLNQAYACFPKKHHVHSDNDGSYYSYFKKQKQGKQPKLHSTNNTPSSFNQLASMNIEQAMLKTRHRRWACQSALAGSHAQSCQWFDLSNRVHYVPVHDIATRRRTSQHFFGYDDSSEDEPTVLARMSVAAAAIRAGALASGIWRTVRLVRLPRGLFEWHWLLWKSRQSVSDEVVHDDDMWGLLQMLGETLPMMDQLEFGGDMSPSLDTEIISDEVSLDDNSNREDWKNEIRSLILQLLPNLIAIDGFEVARKELDRKSDTDAPPVASMMSGENNFDNLNFGDILKDKQGLDDTGSSAACVVCDPVAIPMCGWSHLAQGDESGHDLREIEPSQVDEKPSFAAPEQCYVAGELSSDAIEDVSENVLSAIETFVTNDNRHCNDAKPSSATEKDSSLLSESHDTDADMLQTSSTSSSLLSSQSWNSTNSAAARPPTCPNSTSRSRIPKDKTKKKKKSRSKASGLKRRVMGLIPTVSIMDDEEDSDEDENVDVDAKDSPTDRL